MACVSWGSWEDVNEITPGKCLIRCLHMVMDDMRRRFSAVTSFRTALVRIHGSLLGPAQPLPTCNLPPGSPCPMLTPSGENCSGPEEAAAVSPLWGGGGVSGAGASAARLFSQACPVPWGQTDMSSLPGRTGLKHSGEFRGLSGLRARAPLLPQSPCPDLSTCFPLTNKTQVPASSFWQASDPSAKCEELE